MADSEAATPENLDSFFSLQELIKDPMVSVPKPYLRPELQTPNTFDATAAPVGSVPTIDFSMLVSMESKELELEKLHIACKEWGFFQLVNHGVSSSVMDMMKQALEDFYDLPLEEKMKCQRKPDEAEGYGAVIRTGGKLDWDDRFYIQTNPLNRRNQRLFSELPSSLRNNLESYILEMQKLAMKLLGFIAEVLNIGLQEIKEMFDDGMQSVRMTYYPPCPQPELVVGVTPHSDATGITILNQINGVDGLEIKKDGAWIPITFLPDALVVNIGDILEIMSNGLYKSIEHKVTVNSQKERKTISFFVNPKFEAEIGPVTCLLNPTNPPKYRRIVMEQYVGQYFTKKLYGKSYLELMKIKPGDQTTVLDGSRSGY
ncbi:hypothetical protein K2173_006558 [Erythroxylum novogranatense]|uniref:Fe2OG dioxygenase domain-containing protein n=1 Tax=Erythroxylum novogranatense TaxID=1862640 RepID=A0AAV8T6F0_9ROSI|nr:hypothetical protein K2173_006558 [Erythroxylum novogranatense]